MKSLIKKKLILNLTAIIFVIIFIAGCQQPKPDPSVELKPILDKGIAIWNTGNFDEVEAIWDPNVVRTESDLPDVKGIEGLKNVVTAFRTAYPDMKLTADEEIYAENKITIRWNLTGTNTGPGAMEPTGKNINIWGMSILHFANGKLTREYVGYDTQSLMKQLGYLMMMPMTAEKK
jgi:predicted ester cyclase